MFRKKICVEAVVALLIPMKFFRRTLRWGTVRNIDACVRCTKDSSTSIDFNDLVPILLNYFYSNGSGCPFPRRESVTTANAIATPITAP